MRAVGVKKIGEITSKRNENAKKVPAPVNLKGNVVRAQPV